MTLEVWCPRRAALTRLALLLVAGHVVRLSRRGAAYTVAGGPLGPVRFVPREEGAA